MSLFARLKPPTRAKLSRACGVRKWGPLLESVEPRLLFTTFIVTTASDAPGHTGVSLRDAITSANVNSDADTIHFNIGAGQQVITLQNSALPTISQPLTIDAQSPVDTPAGQIVEVNGASLGTGLSGFTVSAPNSAVQGIRITRFRASTSGAGGNGIEVTANTVGVASCMIGIGADGLPHGNFGRGILVSAGSDSLVVNNTIAYNGDDGVAVTSAASKGLNVFNNSIYSNGSLAIDIGADGVEPNNASDDSGANAGQNFPVITSVTISTINNVVSATVSGTVTSTPNTVVFIDFYAGSVAAREGRVPLTQSNAGGPIETSATTDGTGTASFNNVVLTPRSGVLSLTVPTYITATATASNTSTVPSRLNTSEFSAAVGPAAPPRVQSVYVEGSLTSWSDSFRRFLQVSAQGSKTFGYSIPAGSTAVPGTNATQLKPLTWTTTNQIAIQFNEDVSVQMADFTLRGTRLGTYSVTGFNYDPATYVAIWTLSAPLVHDKLVIVLDSDDAMSDNDGNDGIKDANGRYLDGDFTTSSSVFPSGNGVDGTDFRFRFNSVPGDVNNDTGVNTNDTLTTRSRQGQSATTPGVPNDVIFYDVNTDGGINTNDTLTVRSKQGTSLPSAEPSTAFPVIAPAPKVSSITSEFFKVTTRRSLL